MSNFAERLRQAMFDKRYKAVDVVRGTKIGASVISRYLSGMNQPSRDNLLALGKFLEVTPEWLLSAPDAPKSIQKGHGISRDTEQLQKIIEVQGALIDNLQKQIKEWEEWKASSKDRHAKGKAKADLAISKHKNTLRIKTTRKRKK